MASVLSAKEAELTLAQRQENMKIVKEALQPKPLPRVGRNPFESSNSSLQSRVDSKPEDLTSQATPLQTIVLDGKRYYLVSKGPFEEIRVSGKTYWLVPTTQ